MDAVEKNDFVDLTKGDFQKALNNLATELMKSANGKGRSFPQAYNEILGTRRGRQLYAGYCATPAEDMPEEYDYQSGEAA